MGAELTIAINYLTRFSLPLKRDIKAKLAPQSVSWFPIIGLLIGLAGASIDWIMTLMHMPGAITATTAVIGMLFLTRALHEEEFATLIDSCGKRTTSEDRGGWLKDKKSVRHGTVGIILIILLKITALASLADNLLVFQALIVSASWSRALMVIAAAWLTPLAGDPVADHFRNPPALHVVLSVGLGVLIASCAMGEDTATVLAAGAIAALIVALIGANFLRGYNGALLGALQQIVEVTTLGIVLALQ